MAEPRWVPLGRIGRSHGIRGAFRINPHGETLATRKPGDVLYLRSSAGPVRPMTLVSLRRQGRSWVAQVAEVTTMSAAQQLVGEELCLPEHLLPPAEPGEYYYYQLVGLRVETTGGEFLGTLREILATGANDVYLVDHAGKEVLIPAIADVILAIDLEQGRILVDLPEGLADDL
jgi:16S rRNA processing protein RimM